MTKILVVEDNEYILSSIIDVLQFEGFEAVGAFNGRDALVITHQQKLDLIISDIMMPEMDGYHLLRELQTHPETAFIPFIFLTARADRPNIREGMTSGADDYITKPFSNDELLKAVRARLQKSEALHRHVHAQIDGLHHAVTRTLPHELRTPLIAVLGYGELLYMDADTIQPDQIRERAERIINNGERLQRLIENFLLYAQIELRTTDPGLSAAIEKIAIAHPDYYVSLKSEDVARTAQRRTDLKTDLKMDIHVRIAESDLLKLVEELVSNAFKFSEVGTPVFVSSAVIDGHYQLVIRDLGRGIASQDIERIGAYTQFERALYEQQGMGMGLIIAKRLIELYGGTLSIDSTVGVGTTVTVRLVVNEVAERAG